MSKKDIIMLVVAFIIFAVSGFVAVTQLGLLGGSKQKIVIVEVAPVIPSDIDPSGALKVISDPATAKDFTVQVDLNSGFGTANPFQPQ